MGVMNAGTFGLIDYIMVTPTIKEFAFDPKYIFSHDEKRFIVSTMILCYREYYGHLIQDILALNENIDSLSLDPKLFEIHYIRILNLLEEISNLPTPVLNRTPFKRDQLFIKATKKVRVYLALAMGDQPKLG